MSDQRDAIVDYISERFAQEDETLGEILAAQKAGGGPMMNIGPDQGRFLQLLVQAMQPENILEIGSYYGYSSLWLARGLAPLQGAPSSSLRGASATKQSSLHCVEVSAKQCTFLNDLFKKVGLDHCVQVHQGAGLDLMQKFIDESRSFEMIFVDADKANYSNYLDLAAQLIPSGGLLLVDNCFWNNDVLDKDSQDKRTQSIQAFNDKLAASKDFDSTLLTVQDGLAFCVRT